ncbi:MDR family MFS transporter [Aspergillus lucknowensis]|uniref:MFS general substrate transporter n=1 Tax=Aspergillus lucknowensis TaxID=176173 RepID=A0ABR4LY24_9EURO
MEVKPPKDHSPSPPGTPQDKPDSHHLTDIKLYIILFGVAIATFLISLDTSITATAIPAITSGFHTSSDIGWYGAAYPLTMCTLQPFAGKVATIFSLRASYLLFFGIFLLGSLLCGVANSSIMFIIGRAIAGIGGSGVVSGGLLVIALVTQAEDRPLFTGLIIACYSLGMVIAPIIGGAFTSHVTWRWCFLINLPAGAVTAITLALFVRPPKSPMTPSESFGKRIGQLDLLGCALFVPSIIMVFLALQWGGNEHPWNSATIIGLFVGFAGTILLFIPWEIRRGEHAMIPFTLLKGRSVALSIIFGLLLTGAFVIPNYYLPEWFQIIKDASPMRSGIMLLPAVLTQVFGAIVSGVLAKRVKYYNPWSILGSALLCIASGLYTTFTPFSTTDAEWIGFQILQGLGCGFAAQMALLTVQNELRNRPAIVPIGISTVLFAQYFGSSVVQTIASSIFRNKLIDGFRGGVGLDETGVAVLLEAGNLKVRETAMELFPEKWEAAIGAYNDAITTVFYLAVTASALACVLSAGSKWTNIALAEAGEAAQNEEERGEAKL